MSWILVSVRGAAAALVEYAKERAEYRFRPVLSLRHTLERGQCEAMAEWLSELHVQVATVLDAERVEPVRSLRWTPLALGLISSALRGASVACLNREWTQAANVLGDWREQVAAMLESERERADPTSGWRWSLFSVALHGAERALRARAKALTVPTAREQLEEEFGGSRAENWDQLGILGSNIDQRRGGIFD